MLSDLQDAYTKLLYSEEETIAQLEKAEAAVATLAEKETIVKEKSLRNEEDIEKNQREAAAIQVEIEQWQNQSKDAEDLLKKYSSSYKLKIKVEELYKQVQAKQLLRDQLEGKYALIQEELAMLEKMKLNRLDNAKRFAI